MENNNDKDPIKKKSDLLTNQNNKDFISIHKLIEFIEYEEALTKDKESAARIRNYLKKIGIWS